MFDKKIIVRVDFYPTGEIVPLGITNLNGNSQYIDKIIKIEKHNHRGELKFFCLSNGTSIVLVYKMGVWYKEVNIDDDL